MNPKNIFGWKNNPTMLKDFIIRKIDDYPTNYVGFPFVLGEIEIAKASVFHFFRVFVL